MPDVVIPRDARAEHRRSQAAMLAVEAASRAALRQSVRHVVAHQNGRATGVLVVGRAIEDRVRDLVLDTRRAASAVGTRTLAKEFEVVQKAAWQDRVALPSPTAAPRRDDNDVAVAAEIARGYVDAVTLAGTLDAAVAANDWRLDRIAATETSQAFNRARLYGEQRYREEHRSRWFPAIVKVWDATLDRRTCPVCREKSGTIQPLGASWDGLTPGLPHANCRCTAMILWTPVLLGRRAA